MPKVSIIVPVYNVEQYLRQCLDSILVQTFTDWECILVDDGSKDGSGAICDEYSRKDSRFKTIHKENGGISLARNSGLHIAKGEWIMFVDSDDFILENYIYDTINSINSNIDFVFMGYTLYTNEDEVKKVEIESNSYIGEQRVNAIPIIITIGTPWAKAYKAELLRNNHIEFNPMLSISEDRLFLYSYLSYVKGICILNNVGYYYRQNPNSISTSKRKPYEYLYRFDCLGEKALLLNKEWNIGIYHFFPMLLMHLYFLKVAISELGLSNVKKDSAIANNKDFFELYPNLSLVEKWRLHLKMGINNYALYNCNWYLFRYYQIFLGIKKLLFKYI